MNPNDKVLRAVLPNAGIGARYRKRLLRLVQAMQHSIDYWITSTYRENRPLIAQDDRSAPANVLQAEMTRIAKQWQAQFDAGAELLGEWFAQKTKSYGDGTLRQILKDAGFAVEFKMTAPMRDAYAAVINEQVGLIKSIASQHLTDVQGLVMRSVQQGRNLGDLATELTKRYGITKRRAALIARDQNNKATAVFTRVRHQELGITQAAWRHSHAGKHPRPSHVKADGKHYDVEKGMYIDGKWIWPGTEINCLPGDSVIEFAAGCKKLWRRRYTGELTEIITKSGKTIKATPNHPVLTGRGWIPIQAINVGEDVICVSEQVIDRLEVDVNGGVAKFSEIFDAISRYIVPSIAGASGTEFHGDITDSEIEVVDIDGFLPPELDAAFCNGICELVFADADVVLSGSGLGSDGALKAAIKRLSGAPQGIVSGFCALLPLLMGHEPHAHTIGGRWVANLNSMLNEAKANSSASDAVAFRKLKLADAGVVFGDDQVIGELFGIFCRASAAWNRNAPSANLLGENVGVNPDFGGGLNQCAARLNEKDRVIDKRRVNFFGHVYNLENQVNWYTSLTAIIHNCRCTAQPIIKGFN